MDTDNFLTEVEIFKGSGKYYTTIVVSFKDKHNLLVRDAFKEALKECLKPGDFKNMIAVCINPIHPHAHPQMILVNKIWEEEKEEDA